MAITRSLRWTLGVTAALIVTASATSLPRGQSPGAKEPAQVRGVDTAPEGPERDPEGVPGGLPDPQVRWQKAEDDARKRLEEGLPKIESIRPLPLPDVPDDPPPHEGAMVSMPLTIEPPDIIRIEVLEALPGRPITGDRLVRPDGTISLGFYGSVHLAGLTLEQAKVKLILHLRGVLSDEILGLYYHQPLPTESPDQAEPMPPKQGRDPLPELPEGASPFDKVPADVPARTKPATARAGGGRVAIRLARSQQPEAARTIRAPEPKMRGDAAEAPRAEASREAEKPPADRVEIVPPSGSDRVTVDIGTYNSTAYFVLGELGSGGRYFWTGRDTVLDPRQYAGGPTPDADIRAIRLVRPGRGDKPPRVYPIDLVGIRDRGEKATNFQLFPGDRVIVPKKASAEANARVTSFLQASSTAVGHLTAYAFAMRALANVDEPYGPNAPMNARIKVGPFHVTVNLGPNGMPPEPARRKAALKAWAESVSDDPKVREDLLKLIK